MRYQWYQYRWYRVPAFLSTDYVPGCRIRKLLPGVVPTVFDEYPSYLVPSAKKPRKEPASRCSVPAPKPSKRNAEPEGAVDLPESQDDFADKNIVSALKRQIKTPSELRKQAAYHRSKCSKLQQLLDAARKANAFYRENKRHASVKEVVADSAKGEKKAIFLLHQLDSYGQKRPCYPEEIIRECVVWRFLSPKGYDHARTSQLLTLPAKCTLQRYMGPSPTTTGMKLTDGVGDISGIFVQKLYEHQKDMTVKLARNLTKKHVYPTNLEKMNVLRAVQTFSPQVIAAIEHLQENTGGDSTLYVFSKASSTIHFMKTIKRWFDIHDTTYAGSGQKSPISNTDDPRLLWLANEFTSYIEGIQENSKARGKDGFTCETFEALRFTTKSTVETARFLLRNGVNCVLTRKLNSDPIEAIFGRIRFMCGGNDMLDARAVTTALDHIIKSETSIGKKLTIPCGDAEELAAALPQSLTEELNDLAEYPDTPSPSVTYSGLVYVAGYIAKLISDFECDACSILLETHERSDPLYTLLQSQDFSRLHYPKAEFVALLDKILSIQLCQVTIGVQELLELPLGLAEVVQEAEVMLVLRSATVTFYL
ncbi:hypothetical protein HPB49_011539 [Dermacentor silvarum]|uniref:Uncharacterized protein n=1 Tax=Dermacentor silvarum TaxID=543639 RepID=A0ACB8CEX0_DERSI|nr:hypothetical protein HPB49_011539 [Dermacentor silvarum]